MPCSNKEAKKLKQRREDVHELVGMGFKQNEIAQILKTSLTTVRTDCRKLKKMRRPVKFLGKGRYSIIFQAYLDVCYGSSESRFNSHSYDFREVSEEIIMTKKLIDDLEQCSYILVTILLSTPPPGQKWIENLLMQIFNEEDPYWSDSLISNRLTEDLHHLVWENLDNVLKSMQKGVLPIPNNHQEMYKITAAELGKLVREKMRPNWPSQAQEIIDQALSTLTDRERTVILKRFKDCKKIKEIGVACDLNIERVRRTMSQALHRLGSSPTKDRLHAWFRNNNQKFETPLSVLDKMDSMVKNINTIRDQQSILIQTLATAFGLPNPCETDDPSTPAINPAFMEKLERSVDTLELSVRATNGLQSANIQTIGQLVQRRDNDLLKTRNLGRRSLKEIKEVLGEIGLTLGLELPEPLRQKYPNPHQIR